MCLSVYKKCNLASLFGLAPHSLIEGGFQIITVTSGIACVIIICNPV